jgi:hypothetical protein
VGVLSSVFVVCNFALFDLLITRYLWSGPPDKQLSRFKWKPSPETLLKRCDGHHDNVSFVIVLYGTLCSGKSLADGFEKGGDIHSGDRLREYAVC